MWKNKVVKDRNLMLLNNSLYNIGLDVFID